jgi:hypothetical protein
VPQVNLSDKFKHTANIQTTTWPEAEGAREVGGGASATPDNTKKVSRETTAHAERKHHACGTVSQHLKTPLSCTRTLSLSWSFRVNRNLVAAASAPPPSALLLLLLLGPPASGALLPPPNSTDESSTAAKWWHNFSNKGSGKANLTPDSHPIRVA